MSAYDDLQAARNNAGRFKLEEIITAARRDGARSRDAEIEALEMEVAGLESALDAARAVAATMSQQYDNLHAEYQEYRDSHP